MRRAFYACRRATEVALHALRHFTCSAQQAADDSAQGNTRSEAAQAVALQDFLYWLSSYRCYTWPHMSHV